MAAKQQKPNDAEPTIVPAVIDKPSPSGLALPNAPDSVLDRFRGGGSQSDQRVSLPRIVVLQAMSAEVNRKEEPEQRGTLFNRLTKENLGDKITFIPLGQYLSRVRIVQDIGLVCRSIDMYTAQMPGGLTYGGEVTQDCTNCKLKDWPKDRLAKGDKVDPKQVNRGPECSVSTSFPALLVREGDSPDDYELILLNMAKTSSRAAADLAGMQLGSASPWHFWAYELRVRDAQGPNNTPYWYQDVKRVGKTTPEQRAKATALLSFLAGKQIEVEETEEDASHSVAEPIDTSTEKRY